MLVTAKSDNEMFSFGCPVFYFRTLVERTHHATTTGPVSQDLRTRDIAVCANLGLKANVAKVRGFSAVFFFGVSCSLRLFFLCQLS